MKDILNNLKESAAKNKRFLLVVCIIIFGVVAFNPDQAFALTDKTVTAKPGCHAADIQKLFDENKNGKYNLTVMIPKGTYNMDRTVYVYPNTTVKADDEARLLKQCPNSMIETKLVNDKGGYKSNHDITISGGIWDGKPVIDNEKGVEIFRFIHSNNITVKNATLCNVPDGSHLIVFAGVQNGTVEGCTFYGYGKKGTKMEYQKEAVQIDIPHNWDVVPTAQEVKWDDLPCDNITISKCEFYNFPRGIGSHTAVAGRLHNNVKIINNNFHDMTDTALRLYNYKNTTVKGNTIKNAALGVLVYTSIDKTWKDVYYSPLNGKVNKLPTDYNITIQNNTVENMKTVKGVWGDGIRVMGSSKRPVSGVEIAGNTIKTTARYGIYASYCPKIKIYQKNKFTGVKKDGILIEKSNYPAVYSNSLYKPKGAGIAIYTSAGASVYSNTITGPGNYGIYLLQDRKCKIGTKSTTGNAISGPGKTGIYLSATGKAGCDSITVQHNKISNAKGDGIGAYKSKSLKILYNTVSKPAKRGIYLTGGCNASTVQKNKIKSAKSDGISMQKTARLKVISNVINAGGNGIYLTTKCTSPVIQSNIVSSAGKHGLWVSSGCKKVQILKNRISNYGTKGKYYGIYLYKAGGTSRKALSKIVSNRVAGKGKAKTKDGIRVSSASYISITSNRVSKAPGCGISAFKVKHLTISKNSITGARHRGIWVSRSNSARVSGNRLKGISKRNAVVLTSSKACVKSKNSIKK